MEAAKSADAFKMGSKKDSSSGEMIGENSYPGEKSDSSVKGKEAMLESVPMIYENSIESEIICSSEDRYSDFTQGDALVKRSQINGGALNSSEKKDKAQFQQIYGLTEQDDGQADDPMNNPMGY